MSLNLVNRALKVLFNPTVRLRADFPWGFAKGAKTYVIASLIFFAASLAPQFLFIGLVMYLAMYKPDLLSYFMDGQLGQFNTLTLVSLVATCFVCGFGAELLYIRRCLHKQGMKLRDTMAISLNSLQGSWWAVIWRVLVAFAAVVVLTWLVQLLPLPEARGAAEELVGLFVKHPPALLIFSVLAVFAAPLFEELIFRGFVFNVLRTSLRAERLRKILRSDNAADWAATFISAALFAAAHLSLAAIPALFITGVVLAELYRRSGTLIAPMLLHGVNNLVAVLLLCGHLLF